MKFLIPFVLLMGTLIGCATEVQYLNLREDVIALQEQSETYRAAFLFLAEEMDKRDEAINGLASNDDAVKEILTIARDLIEALNERQKIFDERQRLIMKELELE